MTAINSLTTTTATATLSKLGNGEYTAASVSADAADATKLGLVKEKDGNYGTLDPSTVATNSAGAAALQSSASVQTALSFLTKGGA